MPLMLLLLLLLLSPEDHLAVIFFDALFVFVVVSSIEVEADGRKCIGDDDCAFPLPLPFLLPLPPQDRKYSRR